MLRRRASEVQGKVVQAMGRWPLRHQSSEDLWHVMGLFFCNGGGFSASLEEGRSPVRPAWSLARAPRPLCTASAALSNHPRGRWQLTSVLCVFGAWVLGPSVLVATAYVAPQWQSARWTAKKLISREMTTQNKVGAAALRFAKFGKYHHLSPG